MSRYRRLKIEGGAFFFTLALADRGSNLLVRHIERLRSAYAEMEKPWMASVGATTPAAWRSSRHAAGLVLGEQLGR
jgi:hypothetical protein